MASSPQSNGVSPRPAEIRPAQVQRIMKQFRGCSRISEYEILGKLGEGTFGYFGPPNMMSTTNRMMII